MRILYYHRTLGDGAEGIHIAAMVAAFRVLGHDVRVVGPNPSGAPERPQLLSRIKGALPRVAFEALSVAYNGPTYLEIRGELERFRPNLLYARHARFDVAALAAARGRRVPVVLEVNCLFSTPPYAEFEPMTLHGIARALERRALRLADVVVTVSSPLARQVQTLAGVNALVLPNGADPERFDPSRADGSRVRSRYGLGGEFVVGWTGILREWHGLELLLEAVAGVPSAKLLVVGDGPGRSSMEQRVKALGLEGRVAITGRVAHDDVANHVAAMDVAVVPGERTGVASPMKLLEYMAMARPVVAPRARNIEDLIDDGRDGLLFEPGSSTGLAAVLQRLSVDLELRAALGRNARGKIERERNWRDIAAQVIAAAGRAHRPATAP